MTLSNRIKIFSTVLTDKKTMNRSAAIPTTIVSNCNGLVQVYKRLDQIGFGGFGKVFKVQEQKTKEIFAMKVIPNDKLTTNTEKEFLQNEIALQKSCNHPNIVKIYNSFKDSLNQYIVLEYCPGGSLEAKFKKDGRFNDNSVSEFIAAALDALSYIHSRNIVHRDIKLGNFLIGENGKIKLCDFGLAMKFNPKEEYTVGGTPTYLAPELLIKGSSGISSKNDIWALGVCAFILLNGYPPFEASTPHLSYERIKNGTFRFNSAANISYFARDFINKTLIKDPNERPTADELKRHPMIHKHVAHANAQTVLKLMPSYSVCRFWDLSEKFGFGYLLQDGTVGAVFNDQSRMVTDPHQSFIQYYPPRSSTMKLVNATMGPDVSKKITVLYEFADKLRSGNDMYKVPLVKADAKNPLRYVRHWLRDEGRILFRFDNGDVQVNFEDAMKLFVYWGDQKLMVSSGLKICARCLNMSEISNEGNEEEKRRLAVAKKMLKSSSQRRTLVSQ